MPEQHWVFSVITELCERGVISGYPDGSFKPGGIITRGEFAKLVAAALGLAEYKPPQPSFTGVAPDSWCWGYVEAVSRAGLVKGSGGGEFLPGELINREQMAAMLVRAAARRKPQSVKRLPSATTPPSPVGPEATWLQQLEL
ncbi:MAG: S-layer protein precursor [Pelotomaculum sp. PtaB.Bin013]|uniref:S-layer homology domain-containing protein n=1 Tax=Pelotomaculum isophthalicicum JI TaxID=947010 RepID=A0A9X4H410_9FIRM|nr:S-layer homology domain-containing protein [Pelotomaculum isophthalicicum]MDF9409466.1 S-layer homology domain-containing protein [Pelotomaculum isophthalicicum JI]OPX85703.1 MAG: S-layer protein precursor [Pelotomaculum sp. PtaB.Bin013]